MVSKDEKLLKIQIRNGIMAEIAQTDPARFRERTVAPKKGKHRKDRPRASNRVRKESGE